MSKIRSRKRKGDVMHSTNDEFDDETSLVTETRSNSYESAAYLEGDRGNVVLLLLLYLLQGIPLGIADAIPIILQNKHVSYAEQAEFSLVKWPFSMKLLWAPLVDSFYSSKVGRRKSWLIPTQYALGIIMLLISFNVEYWIGEKGDAPRITLLTATFFVCNFLAATQDIAVDGWALTMLQKRNVAHASTCNSVGQTAGYFLGYVVFIALESADFCNSWLRTTPQEKGVVSFSGFMFFWGLLFIAITTLVGLLKKEAGAENVSSPDSKLSITQSYKLLLGILSLRPVRYLCLVLLSAKIAFAACDSVSGLKLIEMGVPMEKLALLAVPLIPLQIILPFAISKLLIGPRPLDIFMKAIPYRLFIGVVTAFFVWLTPSLISDGIPSYYYALLLVIYAFHQVLLYSMFVSHMAFFAKISDPQHGGTYMTLLNTVSNLGTAWPSTIALLLVECLTWKKCDLTKCPLESVDCKPVENCYTLVDGYYVETVIGTIIGIGWLFYTSGIFDKLQRLGEESWQVEPKRKKHTTKSDKLNV